MSRAYRVEWTVAARTVSTRDEVTIGLTLLGILPEGEMTDLLRDELARDGWKKNADGSMQQPGNGEIAVRLEPDGKTVSLRLESEKSVQARGIDKGAAERALEAQSSEEEKRMKAEVAKQLAAREPDVRAALDQAVQRAYVVALKRKAESLGRVESVQESRGADGEYEVTIKVKT